MSKDRSISASNALRDDLPRLARQGLARFSLAMKWAYSAARAAFGVAPLRYLSLAALALSTTSAIAVPIPVFETQTGIASGALSVVGRQERRDGTLGADLFFGVDQYLADKQYSSQIVTAGGQNKDESYIQFSPVDRSRGFVSALATGNNLEVGSEVRTGGLNDFGWAVARSNLFISNRVDGQTLDALDFQFSIPGGSIALTDFQQRWRTTSLARVRATIDYVLLSPSGPFGGTFEETRGNLFDFQVEMQGLSPQSPQDKKVSLLDTRFGGRRDFPVAGSSLVYNIEGFSDSVHLPAIPPFGQLFVYYDMYSFVQTDVEGLGSAFLGDPTNLVDNGSYALVVGESTPGTPGNPVSEPSGLALLGIGLIGLLNFRKRRSRSISQDRAVMCIRSMVGAT